MTFRIHQLLTSLHEFRPPYRREIGGYGDD